MQAQQAYVARSRKSEDRDLTRRTLSHVPPHKERALWNFLTWSFFIAQVLAAEQFIGAQAKAADALDLKAADPNAATAVPPIETLASDSTAAAAADDSRSNPGISALDDMFAQPLKLGQFDGSVIDLDAMALERAESSSQSIVVAGYGTAGPETSAPGALVPDAHINVGTGLLDLLDDTTGPLLNTVEDIVTSLTGLVGVITDPLLGTVGNLVQSLDDVVHDVIAPVTDLVDNLTQPLDDVLSLPVKLLDGSASPVVALLDLTDDVAGLAQDVLASAGHLAFPVLELAALDDLFSNGRYTDYNIALQSNLPASATASANSDSPPSNPVADMVDKAVDVVAHPFDDAGKHVANILDDLALRGLGDGIS